MQIDENLSRYSDLAFNSGVVVLLLAFLLFAFSYASVRTRAVVAKDRAADKALVGGGEPADVSTTVLDGTAVDDEDDEFVAEGRTISERLGNMGYGLTILGFVLTFASMVLRGFATSRFPLGNMYEFVAVTCVAGLAVGLVALARQDRRPLLAFVLIPVVLLLFIAGTVLYAEAAPVVPALRSYWLPVHVTVISIGSGLLLVSGVASMLFLWRIKHPSGSESDSVVGRWAAKLPDAQYLDRLAYRTVVVGFLVFGSGIVMGAIWAEAAWGRFWGWDPKETVSFIAWVIYAAYLHARATAGWRDTKAAWINIVGFVAMLFNLFIINMVVSGLHSYAGLN